MTIPESNIQSPVGETEKREFYTSKPRTIYALVTRYSTRRRGERFNSIDADYVIESGEYGPVLLDNEEGEHTYDGCDYVGLSGLITFDGALYTKLPAYDDLDADAREDFSDRMGFDFDEFEEMSYGEWRPMTAEEAVSLGLLASIPSQIEAASADSKRLVWMKEYDADFGSTMHVTLQEGHEPVFALASFVRVPCKYLYEWHCYDGATWRDAIDNAMAAPPCKGEDGECDNSNSIREPGAFHAKREREEAVVAAQIEAAVKAERESCEELANRMALYTGVDVASAIRARGEEAK